MKIPSPEAATCQPYEHASHPIQQYSEHRAQLKEKIGFSKLEAYIQSCEQHPSPVPFFSFLFFSLTFFLFLCFALLYLACLGCAVHVRWNEVMRVHNNVEEINSTGPIILFPIDAKHTRSVTLISLHHLDTGSDGDGDGDGDTNRQREIQTQHFTKL